MGKLLTAKTFKSLEEAFTLCDSLNNCDLCRERVHCLARWDYYATISRPDPVLHKEGRSSRRSPFESNYEICTTLKDWLRRYDITQ